MTALRPPQLLLRRFWTSHAYQRTAAWVRPVSSAVLVLVMANLTAFMETLTIASVRTRPCLACTAAVGGWGGGSCVCGAVATCDGLTLWWFRVVVSSRTT